MKAFEIQVAGYFKNVRGRLFQVDPECIAKVEAGSFDEAVQDLIEHIDEDSRKLWVRQKDGKWTFDGRAVYDGVESRESFLRSIKETREAPWVKALGGEDAEGSYLCLSCDRCKGGLDILLPLPAVEILSKTSEFLDKHRRCRE